MKLTIAKLLGLRNVLKAIAEIEDKIEIEGKARYNLIHNLNRTNTALISYDELWNKLIVKYGDKTKEGYSIVANSPGQKSFNDDITEAIKGELDVDLRPITEEAVVAAKHFPMLLVEQLMVYGLVKEAA